MVREFCSLIIFLCIFSCKPEYKSCEIKTKDVYLKAYNDILNEIIVQRSYNRYLGPDDDSNLINDKIIRLHNKIFHDTSRFCTIYIDTLLRPAFNSWSYFQKDTNSFSVAIRNVINKFSDNQQA